MTTGTGMVVDTRVYIMHKVWIGTIHGLSCPNLRSELCTTNLKTVQALATVISDTHAFMCMLIKLWPIVRHSILDKNFLSTKKIESKLAHKHLLFSYNYQEVQ